MARWRTKTGGMAELGERDNIGRVHQHSKSEAEGHEERLWQVSVEAEVGPNTVNTTQHCFTLLTSFIRKQVGTGSL